MSEQSPDQRISDCLFCLEVSAFLNVDNRAGRPTPREERRTSASISARCATVCAMAVVRRMPNKYERERLRAERVSRMDTPAENVIRGWLTGEPVARVRWRYPREVRKTSRRVAA
jgi:hypothetical protein